MKSFADIKRRFAPGTVLECVENTRFPNLNGTRRIISKVQTNAIACTLADKPGLFWTNFPKAKDVTVLDPDTFRFALGAGCDVTLRFCEMNHA